MKGSRRRQLWEQQVSTKQQPQETGSQMVVGHYKVRFQEGFEGRYLRPFRLIPGINTKQYYGIFLRRICGMQ